VKSGAPEGVSVSPSTIYRRHREPLQCLLLY